MERITPPKDTRPDSSSIARSRVLIVEDNAINRKIAHAALQHLDIELLEAINGKEAIVMTERMRPDCILMDIRMPEMDGIRATREIRRHADAEQLPIIGITAHALQSEIEKAIAAGMNRVVTKPIDIHALAEDVETLLAQRHDKQAAPEIDFGALFHDLGHDTALYRDVVTELSDRLLQLSQQVDAMLAEGAEKTVSEALDRLSDTLATLHARKAMQRLEPIVSAAREHDMHLLQQAWPSMRQEIEQLLQTIASQQPASPG